MKHLLFYPDDKLAYIFGGKLLCTKESTLYPRRVADDFLLLWGSAGGYRLQVDGTEYHLTEGHFLLIFPGSTYFGMSASTPEHAHYQCHFRLPTGSRHKILDVAERDAHGLTLPVYGSAPMPRHTQMLFDLLFEAARRHVTCRDSLCDMTLALLLASLTSDSHADNAPHSTVIAAKAADWIRLHVAEINSAKDVAAHFGYNCEYLTTALRRATGKTLTAHIRDARIEQAQSLLLCTDLSVKEIAYRCGFSDDKYFLKVFRTATGVTPGQCRNAFVHVHHSKK